MENPVPPLLCQAASIQGSKPCVLLWAPCGEDARRRTSGLDDPGLGSAAQTLCQELYPDRKVALVEPQPPEAAQPEGQQAGEGRPRPFPGRPMRGRPPQAGASALAEAPPLCRLGRAAGGPPQAWRLTLRAVWKEDGRAAVPRLARAFRAPLPLPTPSLAPPGRELESGGKARREAVVSHPRRARALHRWLRAGTVAGASRREGDAPWEQALGGLALPQGQGASWRALAGGAAAHEPWPRDAREPLGGWAGDLEPPALGPGPGVIRWPGPLGEAAHPARRDGRQEGTLGPLGGP